MTNNVFRRVAPSRGVDPLPDRENTDGFVGRLHVDLSEFAANEPSVIVRFRQFEPSWDWWVAIDNLLIDSVPPPQGGAEELMDLETFDGLIPNDWDFYSLADPENEGPDSWNAEDFCRRDVSPAADTQIIKVIVTNPE